MRCPGVVLALEEGMVVVGRRFKSCLSVYFGAASGLETLEPEEPLQPAYFDAGYDQLAGGVPHKHLDVGSSPTPATYLVSVV